ncbi:TonB-dependent receptor [uncultured Caulobacter sp.]|uniref:TonB-dependent receptor domain-containing protein n=1 Tax=uncultured Caulobacter sp. TaxID=158749 RepID=UPI00262F51D5|nr:TonB-dependent receptor [uncultured Caulobacter sp.]
MNHRFQRASRALLLTGAASLLGAGLAHAQAQAPASAPPQDAATVEEVIVVGTQIAGSKVTAAVPVTVVDAAQIATTGAVSGDDLLRSVPQMGNVTFNSTNGATSSNFARGDVGSINLRDLGVGNTLVLLNGRRVVTWPGTQADSNLAPVLTTNSNTLPVSGIQRLEVLRDGAAALYGADAVAGVLNTVLRDDLDGGTVTVRYGGAEGTSMRDFNLNFAVGQNFKDGRGNVTLSADYAYRSALKSTDLDYTASGDKRPLFAGTSFAGSNTLDRRSTLSPWADLTVIGQTGAVRQGTTNLTTAAGVFHIQPTADGSCGSVLAGGICIGTGTRATSGAARDTRSDAQSVYGLSVMPKMRRTNLFSTWRYDLTDDVTAYGELGYYISDTHSVQDGVFTIGSTKIAIPASNYWNPFGPVTFADGTVNPNRLANLNIPASGRAVSLTNYRFGDLGPTNVDVKGKQVRVLGGLKGNAYGFRWDSALLYTEAGVTDVQDGVSSTALQKQLALSTPDAYNPFNGGSASNPTGIDGTPSSKAALDAIRVKTYLKGRSTLAQWDFKVSKADLLALPAGDLGLAAGVELRRETISDNRDARVDGTIKFTDAVTGEVQTSDLFGVSPTPDSKGSRKVASAYAELAVPVVSPDMNVPLVRNVEVQLAGRYEHYSDFGDVAKPKVALAWDLFDGVRVRGSYSKGFRAPNLLQVNSSIVTRGNTRTDYIFCEADLRAGRISSFSACSASIVATAQRAGNPDLKAETSESQSIGLVLQPKFIPSELGRFTLTVDVWDTKQNGIIGVFGEGNALILDYLLRVQGSSNPNVIRLAPTADDIARTNGTGLAAVGQVTYVKDQYQNLNPQDVRGLDVSLNWRLHGTRFGDFDADINVAHFNKFYRQPSAEIAELLAARQAGKINAGTSITGGGDLLRQNGTPKTKVSASLTWRYEQLTVGAFTKYISSMDDTSLLATDGTPWQVESQVTGNLYGQWAVGKGRLEGSKIRLGVNNITNENPPLASGTYGYLGAVYQPYARYWYLSLSKSF